MARVSQMQDIPWHLETLHRQENDPRRHRSRCKYFVKKTSYCSRRNGKCFGSAHCMEYMEKMDNNVQKSTGTSIKSAKPFSAQKKVEQVDLKKYSAYRKIGTKVNHIKQGEGVIVKSDDKTMTIHFKSGFEGKFDIKFSVEKGFVKLL